MENWSKIKPKVNLVIDTLMFLVLMSVAGLGFLMKFVLLPGYKINEIYGTDTDLFFRGLDRHQWGAIHLYLALSMVFLLIFHIIFHWSSIVSIFKRMIPVRTMRWIIALFVGILSIILVIVPILVKPEVAEHQRTLQRNRVIRESGTGIHTRQNFQRTEEPNVPEDVSTAPKTAEPEEPVEQKFSRDTEAVEVHLHNQVDIDGTMTLHQVAARYNINVEELAASIDVPTDYAYERLGRLRRRFGFEMDDLREYVLNKTQENDR
jgi:hypothetical protein